MQFYFFSHAGRKILLRFIPVSVPSAGSVLCRSQKVRATFIAS
jgi:hypothetical protein